MTTRAAAKRHFPDAQVTVSPIESTEMDNSDKDATVHALNKLNNIITKTYRCVIDKKKKKKLLHNTKMGQLEEALDTYKYSDYPETGITPLWHAPPAAGGPQAAVPAPAAVAAPAPGPVPVAAAAVAPAAAIPAVATAAGGVPHLAPAPPGPIPAAAPLGPLPFAAAAAALPADADEFVLPEGWPELYPLPPESSDSSSSDEFFDAASANNSALAPGEDGLQLEGQVAQDNDPNHLEENSCNRQPLPPRSSPPFQGFPTPPRRV